MLSVVVLSASLLCNLNFKELMPVIYNDIEINGIIHL